MGGSLRLPRRFAPRNDDRYCFASRNDDTYCFGPCNDDTYCFDPRNDNTYGITFRNDDPCSFAPRDDDRVTLLVVKQKLYKVGRHCDGLRAILKLSVLRR